MFKISSLVLLLVAFNYLNLNHSYRHDRRFNNNKSVELSEWIYLIFLDFIFYPKVTFKKIKKNMLIINNTFSRVYFIITKLKQLYKQ